MSGLKLLGSRPNRRVRTGFSLKMLLILAAVGMAVASGGLVSSKLTVLIVDGQFSLFLAFSAGFAFIGQLIARQGNRDEFPFQVRLFLAAFVIRVLLAIILYLAFLSMFGHPFAQIGGDDIAYHARGHALASDWRSGWWHIPQNEAAGYDSIVAFFYLLFGTVPLVVRSLNCFAGALCAIYVYRIANQLLGAKVGRTAAILVALVPDLVFWSTIGYRDILLAAVLLYLVNAFVIMRAEAVISFRRILIAAFAFALYSMLDLKGAVILLAGGLLYYVVSDRAQSLSPVRWFFFIVLIFGFFFALLGGVSDLYEESLDPEYLLAMGNSKRQSLAAASTSESLSSVFWSDLRGWKGIVISPVRFLFPLLTPVPSPFDLPELNFLFLFIGAIFWYLMIPCAVYGLIHCLRNSSRDTFLLYGLPFLFLVGIFAVYYTGSYRYRVRFMPLLWILTAIGIVNWRRWHRWYVMSLIGLSLVFLLYIALKWSVII